MHNRVNTILSALDFFDKSKEKYLSLMSKVKFYSITKSTNDVDKNYITLYDSANLKLFSSRFELMARYEPQTNIWCWAWNLPFEYKNITSKSRELLNYGFDLDPHVEDTQLRNILTSGRFVISDDIELDMYTALASYLTKLPLILQIHHQNSSVATITGTLDPMMSNTILSEYLYLFDHKEIETLLK